MPFDRWSTERAAELYGIRDWSQGYFSIDTSSGEVVVNLEGRSGCGTISLMGVVEGLRERGLELPVLLRFGDLLDARLRLINNSFRKAIAEHGYRGEYRGVYPIKVNQQQQVIEELTSYGKRFHHGLEAGSKAELLAALSYIDDPDAFVICNGYKDEEFIDLALYGLKLGIRTILVVEMPSELSVIAARAAALDVRPLIGLRMRPSTRAGGLWQESGGDRSVFGLNAAQLVEVIDDLRARGMLDCLTLLHYHLGSQIPNIRDIRRGISEACRFYVELCREGAAMGLLDVGGGLAVDYDGSHTNFSSSRNYTLQEYCGDIVEAVVTICDEAEVAHPTIISESGRATVAYYSVLLFNVLGVNRYGSYDGPVTMPDDVDELVQNMLDVRAALSSKNAQECLHDLLYYRDELQSRFRHGTITLRVRALGEQIFWSVLRTIWEMAHERRYVPEEIANLGPVLSDIYYCNFSVFQSLPDAWAIEQLFPILPVHRLNERPTREGILADITCDCDGKIDRFIDLHDVRRSLPLHEFRDGDDYILGAFLVGAYQETLGDLHNLLGDTNVVSVRCGDDGRMEFTREIAGDTVADVLSYVEYDPRELEERLRRRAEQAVHEGRITALARREILNAFQAGLRGYTYYEQ